MKNQGWLDKCFFFLGSQLDRLWAFTKTCEWKRREAKFGPAEESPVSAQEGQGEEKGRIAQALADTNRLERLQARQGISQYPLGGMVNTTRREAFLGTTQAPRAQRPQRMSTGRRGKKKRNTH